MWSEAEHFLFKQENVQARPGTLWEGFEENWGNFVGGLGLSLDFSGSDIISSSFNSEEDRLGGDALRASRHGVTARQSRAPPGFLPKKWEFGKYFLNYWS